VEFVDGVVCEPVGDDYLLLTPHLDVVRLTGSDAHSVRVMLEQPQELSPDDIARLRATGLVNEVESSGLSRRSVIVGSAATFSAGLVTMGLPVAAHAASGPSGQGAPVLSSSDVWGNYYAGAFTATGANNTPLPGDLVVVVVFIGQQYQDRLGLGFFTETAGWPEGINPDDSWDLVFGNKSVSLDVFIDSSPTEDYSSLSFQAYSNEDVDDDAAQEWSEELFNFLKDDWANSKVISLAVTNGAVTIPVSLYPQQQAD
jgi:hypothetical protein